MSYNNNGTMHGSSPGGHRLASEMERKTRASHEGAAFVAMVCDPFANTPVKAVGMPDATSGNSVAYRLERDITISAPPGLPQGASWDCHVALLPLVGQQPSTLHSFELDGFGRRSEPTVPAPTTEAIQFLSICSVPEGASTFYTSSGGPPEIYYEGISVDPLYGEPLKGRVRVLGGGFKAVNTTSELHKSGSVTCYSQEGKPAQMEIADITAPVDSSGRFLSYVANTPPNDVAAAKQLRSCTHSAAEGALVIAHVDSHSNDAEPTKAAEITYLTSVGDAAYGTMDYPFNKANTLRNPVVAIPMAQSGAYFTGLAYESTLTITLRCFVELFPAPNSELMALADPAPKEDVVALEFAARLLSQMQPGYPASHNSFGTFTKGLLGAARSLIAETNAVAHGVATVSDAILKVTGGKKAKKAKKKKAK